MTYLFLLFKSDYFLNLTYLKSLKIKKIINHLFFFTLNNKSSFCYQNLKKNIFFVSRLCTTSIFLKVNCCLVYKKTLMHLAGMCLDEK